MIKDILYRVLGLLRTLWTRIHLFFTRLGWKKSLALIVAAVIIIWIAMHFLFGGAQPATTASTSTPTVQVLSVVELMQGGSMLSIAGQVQSQAEATVNSEKAGQIISVNYALGDYVTAGSVIAQLEHSSESAAVLQAQGAVQAATAGANVSQTDVAGARTSAVTSLLSAYAAANNAIVGGTDSMFTNPTSAQPQLSVQSSDSQAVVDTQNMRTALGPIFAREQVQASTLSTNDDLQSELAKTEAELGTIRSLLDTLIRALNAGIVTQNVTQAQLEADKTIATGARSSIIASLSALLGAGQSLSVASQNSAQGSGTNSASQAALTQAQGALAAAQAAFEKTVVRAPISGTINSLPLKVGNFVGAFSPVVTIANNQALEIIAYVTQNDTAQFSVGSKATVEGSISGVVTRIAPALDPLTKKIEVRIGIPGNSTLVNGQSVSVEIAAAAKSATTPVSTRLTIPLAALKIGADGMNVFTVSSSSTLVSNPVQIGELLGDRVVITSGITADTNIVTDARGLRAGELVSIR